MSDASLASEPIQRTPASLRDAIEDAKYEILARDITKQGWDQAIYSHIRSLLGNKFNTFYLNSPECESVLRALFEAITGEKPS